MTRYHVRVDREDRWWIVTAEGPDGKIEGATQARRLADVEQNAREFIAVTEDVPISTVEVVIDLGQIGQYSSVGESIRDAKFKRSEAVRLEAEAALELGEIAYQLQAEEVPLRDIGTLLGVSFQRADQMAKAVRDGRASARMHAEVGTDQWTADITWIPGTQSPTS